MWEREREREGARERATYLRQLGTYRYTINGQSQIVSALIENYLRLP